MTNQETLMTDQEILPTSITAGMTDQEILGALGEIQVENLLNSCGFNARLSEDKYDKNGDLYLDNVITKPHEVKTQTPYVLKNAFCILLTQLPKCLAANKLYFVFVPHTSPALKHEWEGSIFCHYHPDKLEYDEITVWDKRLKKYRDMILIPFVQQHMEIVGQVDKDYIKFMQQYSTSDY